ncbi:protein ZINC INDUCED FACILITATOR 1-like isoform X2 [Silene latifolia]|uniref:protein ZINC INDUCED FACILITATOR 1-like isoform X2 n=1 Tax=Silene latifolia TaxID=37657 RepID=UPI003D778CA6
MAENEETLLLKSSQVEYDENCPGCKVDRRKAQNPNIPWLHFSFIWIITLSSSLPISSIFPFLYYMVRDFHIAKREEDISFYAGFEGSAFMVGRFLTALLWGMVADRYGRKTVMILSMIAIVIFNTLFGLSTSYWMALTMRFLLGAFCGVLGPMRAYATEVSRQEHQALGIATLSSAWGIGLVIGPALGGYLAQPADKFPNIFSQESVFGRFPYFLVCLVISIFALIVLIICFWLPETLHSHDVEDAALIDSDDLEKSHSAEGRTSNTWLSLLRNWPLMSVIIIYCVFQLHDMAYIEIFSLWAVSPKAFGGLSLATEDVGQALAVAGVGLLLCQLLLYPVFERAFGPIIVSRTGAALSIALLSCYPFIAKLSGTSLSLVIDLVSALKNAFSISVTAGLFLLQNRAVRQRQRGAANGLALCMMSLCKAVGPAAAGSLLSWGQSRQNASFLPGSHMVFFILNVVELIGFLMTFKPFLAEPNRD